MSTTTNTNNAEGHGQYYGISQQGTNSNLYQLYGVQEIKHYGITGKEGVESGAFADEHTYSGQTGYYTTRSIIKTFDLISEGEIEGIASGEWVPTVGENGEENKEGQIGWQGVKFEAFADQNPESFLRSVYLNDTPVVNEAQLYNFQACEVAITNGVASGISANDDFLYVDENAPIEKTRKINERLRGPDINDENDSPFYYYPKVYRFLNKDLDKVRINIRIPSLSYTKVQGSSAETVGEGSDGSLLIRQSDKWPLEEVGQQIGSELTFKLRYRPIYQDSMGNIGLGIAKGWYGLNGSEGTPITSVVKGLVTSTYLHDIVIEFKDQLKISQKGKEVIGWEVEVTRITLDAIESHVSNQTYVDSITEVFESTLSYPNSAMASMNFNAEYFSSVPTRAYDMRLLKVKVPRGYDPISKQYNHSDTNGYWDGSFQDEKKWTDNPAWIFYDLLTNKRYGVGKYIDTEYQVDQWTLYEISKFCDTLVSNGDGGFEPRFTCNTLINTREDAFKVIKDFASVFRSMAYYGFGAITAAMDKPRGTVAQFNNASVKEGNFTYSSSSKKSIPTVCLVRYNDKSNFYKPAIEYVENPEGIRKYGVKEKEITAFACTSRSQAMRLGRWILSTEIDQTERISFSTGAEAILLKPGDIVSVTDGNRSSDKYAGRIIKEDHQVVNTNVVSGQSVVLDRKIDLSDATNYTISLSTPTYFYDQSVTDITGQQYYEDFRRNHVQTFDFNSTTDPSITLSTVAISGSSEPSGTKVYYTGQMFSPVHHEMMSGAAWSLFGLSEKNRNLYSVTSISENADSLDYKVEGIVHNTGKYSYIESGVYYSYVQTPQGAVKAPSKPHAVLLNLISHPHSATNNTKVIEITIDPCAGSDNSCLDSPETTVGYRVFIKEGSTFSGDDLLDNTSIPKDSFFYQSIYTSSSTLKIDYVPSTNAVYYVRVFSINGVSVLSNDSVENNITVSNHFPIRDVKIHSLRLAYDYLWSDSSEEAPTRVDFTRNNKDAIVQWRTSFLNEEDADTKAVLNDVINYKVTVHESNAGSIHPGAQLAAYNTNESIFNFSFDRNKAMTVGSARVGPKRNYDLVVQAIDDNGISSSGVASDDGWDIVSIANPKPTGYYMTPREQNGVKVGAQQSCDPMWTEQFLDADGFAHIKFLANSFADIAGGYAYISKHPFSGGDFHAGNGKPKTIHERTGNGAGQIYFTEQEEYKTGQYEILETNFELAGASVLGTQDSEVIFKPNLTGVYAPPYYMGIKLYDSFDRELKNDSSLAAHSTWNSGLITSASQILDDNGLYLGMARDTTGVGGAIQTQEYCYTKNTCLNSLGAPDAGNPKCDSHTYSEPIYPTKYYSANQGGFKYWIRININGQWEGQGVSHVKVLTQKDVQDLYDYHGFFEYSCTFDEYRTLSSDGGSYIQHPNQKIHFGNSKPPSTTRCSFRQGQVTVVPDSSAADSDGINHVITKVGEENVKQGGNVAYNYDNAAISAYFFSVYPGCEVGYDFSACYPSTAELNDPDGPYLLSYGAQYLTTGATRMYGDIAGYTSLPAELSRAGIARGWTPAGEPNMASMPTQEDEINSYNERGQLLNNRSRPLRGFRRYRVYFDEMNLPQAADSSGLASYAIVGLNCWNGAYESWPQDPAGLGIPATAASLNDIYEDSLLFAKDGHGIFPKSVRSWLSKGDVFENIPGVWNHHPAGFGQGYGALIKTQKYFDIHMGRMVDDSYLNEAFFGVVATNDYGISSQLAQLPAGYDYTTDENKGLHEAVYNATISYVSASIDSGGDGTDPYPS